MSLRLRLLLALGAVTLVALLVADVAIYSALRSFLDDRVERSLDGASGPVEDALRRDPRRGQVTVALAPDTYVLVRGPFDDDLDELVPRRAGELLPRPVVPDDAAHSAHAAADPVFVTVRSETLDGPSYRLRISPLGQRATLILGVPIDETAATLRRLATIELAVTLAALGAAIGLGWSVVAVGLRPLADVERTAGAIAAGQLDQRVPNADASPTKRRSRSSD
jgi:two-component system, OmpR family, sensor kinase